MFRQERMSARWGAPLSRRTMCDWVEVAALWLEPVYRHMHRALIAGDYLQADETPVRCNDPDHQRGKTLQCYLWVISRPKSDVVFAFRESRAHDELPSLLGRFRGLLQSDQYGAYASHERKTKGIVRVGCWAHARRRFHEAIAERPKAANLVLKLISHLYRLEAAWDEMNVGDGRAALRQEHFARPLRWLKRIVTGLARQALPQSLLGKACTYLLNHWEVLVAHQQHSVTRIDNNLVENAIRPSAIGRKYAKLAVMESWPAGTAGSTAGVASSRHSWFLKDGELFRGQVPRTRRCFRNTNIPLRRFAVCSVSFT